MLFIHLLGISLLLITVLGLATLRYRGGGSYRESSSTNENVKKDSRSGEQLENSNLKDQLSKQISIEKSSLSYDSSKDTVSNDEDTKDTKQEKTLKDDNLLKITLRDLSNISIAPIEGEDS